MTPSDYLEHEELIINLFSRVRLYYLIVDITKVWEDESIDISILDLDIWKLWLSHLDRNQLKYDICLTLEANWVWDRTISVCVIDLLLP